MSIYTEKFLVIGAGPTGLAMAKALKDAGIAYEQVEADDVIGGNWYHGVYKTAHIISSRKLLNSSPVSEKLFTGFSKTGRTSFITARIRKLPQMINFTISYENYGKRKTLKLNHIPKLRKIKL